MATFLSALTTADAPAGADISDAASSPMEVVEASRQAAAADNDADDEQQQEAQRELDEFDALMRNADFEERAKLKKCER